MARGFLSGALLGGVLSTGAAVVASLIAPLPQPPVAPEISDTAPGETVAPQAVTSQSPDPQVRAEDTAVSSDKPGAQAVAPDPDTLTGVTEETITPSSAPQTAQAPGMVAPSDAPAAGGVSLDREEPVLPNPQALAPMEPQPADEIIIATEPAAPPVVEAEVAEDPTDDALPTQRAERSDEAPAPSPPAPEAPVVADTPATTAEASPTAPQVAEPQDGAEDAQTIEPQPQETEQAQVSDIPVVTPDSTAPAEPDTSPQAQPEPETTDTPQVAMIAPSSRPQIGTPAISLTERQTGVTVNRPAIGTNDADAPSETDSAASGTVEGTADRRPVMQFSQPFENPENKPLMSIVLIDDGAGPISGAAGIAALRSFPYALSFAVDSSLPDAAARMAVYRAEGFEVLAMIDLPEGAQPRDVETTLDATLSQLPEAMGVLEGAGAGLQETRIVADQVTAFLAQSGHGLVTQDKGLNTMPKLARKEGVPATPIFRDFDSKGQTATVIRRFLDQAAFKAGQEGSVIMLGRLRADTISALLLWGLQDRAGQVALAPVSAVLLREEAG